MVMVPGLPSDLLSGLGTRPNPFDFLNNFASFKHYEKDYKHNTIDIYH
jgi:hypothetical protein